MQITPEHIIFEDRILLIANKPAGVPSSETLKKEQGHFYGALQNYLDKREGRATYLAIHHRLDQDTSGLLLFCKKKSFNRPVSDLFLHKKIRKTYLALAHLEKGELPPVVKNFLRRSKKSPMVMESCNEQDGGQSAETHFEVLGRQEKRALVTAQPMTGRMHQIRVHLSELGAPVVGDSVYGTEKNSPHLFLHAWKLEFPHPETGVLMAVQVLPPDYFLKEVRPFQHFFVVASES
ncbi:MAG TPA: RNA pseudouridine synthase [Bdellovibrionales bacterium]|nr:RNA pseudouridine synthase [Bdellovibrionales bacterium]